MLRLLLSIRFWCVLLGYGIRGSVMVITVEYEDASYNMEYPYYNELMAIGRILPAKTNNTVPLVINVTSLSELIHVLEEFDTVFNRSAMPDLEITINGSLIKEA